MVLRFPTSLRTTSCCLMEKVKRKCSNIRERLSPAPSEQPSRQPSPLPLLNRPVSGVNEITTNISSAQNILEAQLPDISHRLSSASSEYPSRQPSPLSCLDPSNSVIKEPTTGLPSAPIITEWNIDASSISQLRVWGAAREGSKWIQLLEEIDRALKSRTLNAIISFVPDSPLPARTLVGALLNLVQLAINIPMIQKKVYDFSQDAINYIREIVAVVGEEDSLKDGLNSIFGAVDNVCQWASERVPKTSLSEEELGEWKENLVRAKEIFLATSLIRIQATKAASDRQSFIEKKLATHIASHYEHTDQRKNTCAAGTRREVLGNINQWLLQPSGGEHIYWIMGLPGSGKSTISATIVETLRKLGTPVAAQYFISRNFVDTTDPDRLLPTIVKQLAERFPAAARVVHDVLKNGFPSGRDELADSLFLRPVHAISKLCDVAVIIIDALDELRSDADKMVSLLASIGARLPDSVKFIITSRSESWSDITKANPMVFRQHDLSTADSGNEVGTFIRSSIKEITPNEQGWEDWPSDQQLSKLVDNAGGLFHYAATAIAWIKLQIDTDGTAVKESVLQEVNSCGVGSLDELYNVILTKWRDMGENPGKHAIRLECFRHVVGCIVVLERPLSVGEIIALLAHNLPAGFDVLNFLRQMRSIFAPGTASPFTLAIPQIHKSFYDFITSDRSPADFRVVVRDAHLVTAKSCMTVIVMAGSQPNTSWRYAVGNWCEHLQKAMEGGADYDVKTFELLTQMMTDTSIGVWARGKFRGNIFMNVAKLGWGMLKRNMPEDNLQLITDILAMMKEV